MPCWLILELHSIDIPAVELDDTLTHADMASRYQYLMEASAHSVNCVLDLPVPLCMAVGLCFILWLTIQANEPFNSLESLAAMP